MTFRNMYAFLAPREGQRYNSILERKHSTVNGELSDERIITEHTIALMHLFVASYLDAHYLEAGKDRLLSHQVGNCSHWSQIENRTRLASIQVASNLQEFLQGKEDPCCSLYAISGATAALQVVDPRLL